MNQYVTTCAFGNKNLNNPILRAIFTHLAAQANKKTKIQNISMIPKLIRYNNNLREVNRTQVESQWQAVSLIL